MAGAGAAGWPGFYFVPAAIFVIVLSPSPAKRGLGRRRGGRIFWVARRVEQPGLHSVAAAAGAFWKKPSCLPRSRKTLRLLDFLMWEMIAGPRAGAVGAVTHARFMASNR